MTAAPSQASAEEPALDPLRSLDALEALRPEWQALWRACPDPTPFQAPAWLLPWARHHAPDRTLGVAVRSGGALRTLVPLFTWEGALLLAGTGPSDYGDGLFSPDFSPATAERVLAALARLAAERGCERVDLQQLRPGSPLLQAAAPHGWSDAVVPGETCPVAPLTAPEGLGGVDKIRRQKLAYARRKTARHGAFAVERATAETLEEIREALFALHGRRWREAGEPGVLADALTRRFHEAALPELLADGLLRLYGLRLDGRIAAAIYALAGPRETHHYLAGYDPELGALGLGTILIGEVMAGAFAEGHRHVDFLRGREPYKYWWGAEDRPTFRRILTRAGQG